MYISLYFTTMGTVGLVAASIQWKLFLLCKSVVVVSARPPPSHRTDLWRHWRGRPCSHASGSLVEAAITEQNGYRMGYLICCWSLTNFILVFQYSIGIIVSIIRKLRCIDTETDKTLWEKGATKLAAWKSSNILKLDKLLLFLRFADETLSITGIPHSEKSLRNIPWFSCLSLEAILGLSDSPKSYQIFIHLRLPATERSAARTVRQCSGILSGGHWTRTFDSGLVQGSLHIAWIDTLWLFNIAMENGPFIDGLPGFTY